MPLFTILTLFPDAVEAYLSCGVVGLAHERGLVRLQVVDFRDWTRDRHRTVDDRPFGGGPGMVLKPEPIAECVEWIEERDGPYRRIALCPAGRRLDQPLAEELSRAERVLLLAGRYEGFDERVFDVLDLEPVSIGDFVLSGGELPALCVVDAAVRLLPGALGDERSALRESFQVPEGAGETEGPAGHHGTGGLDHPHYTRPRVFRGREVPEVLLTGDHAAIEEWRREQSRKRTRERRPDLLGEDAKTPRDQDPPSHLPHLERRGRAAGGTQHASDRRHRT